MAGRRAVVRWLLAGDPSIRWQVLRDLEHAPGDRVARERALVACEGWCADLLSRQAPGGYWGGPDDDGWMATIDALVLAKDMGLDPDGEAARIAIGRVNANLTWWQLDGRAFFDGETEACINGRILAVGSYFGQACDRLLQRLLEEQLADGGWNCEAPPSVRSSFHTTICVLEGLLAYERAHGVTDAVTQARQRGHDYLLERRLGRSLRTGAVIDRSWQRFAFPPVWHYDLLRALDCLRDADITPDARMGEAIGIVRSRAHQNGRWPRNIRHDDRIGLPIEPDVGVGSRWNTLRALRVLDWYERTTTHQIPQA